MRWARERRSCRRGAAGWRGSRGGDPRIDACRCGRRFGGAGGPSDLSGRQRGARAVAVADRAGGPFDRRCACRQRGRLRRRAPADRAHRGRSPREQARRRPSEARAGRLHRRLAARGRARRERDGQLRLRRRRPRRLAGARPAAAAREQAQPRESRDPQMARVRRDHDLRRRPRVTPVRTAPATRRAGARNRRPRRSRPATGGCCCSRAPRSCCSSRRRSHSSSTRRPKRTPASASGSRSARARSPTT